MELLTIENLSFTYPLCSTPAVTDVSFSVKKGEFVSICGATGSGKSTLLRLLKRELAPLGERSGQVYLDGTSQEALSADQAARSIGFVMQRPEHQLVTDKVWHELAFGLENMGTPQSVIARRIAEMASYFGIEDWFEKNVTELSDGQKQLLNLAAVMIMNPKILILDEPTAQLDPIAASDFIATLRKLNRELSLTILIVEHRLEEVIPISDRLLVMEKGRLLAYDEPRAVIEGLKEKPELLCAMPAAARLYHAVQGTGECPLDISEGRAYIQANFGNQIRRLPDKVDGSGKPGAVGIVTESGKPGAVGIVAESGKSGAVGSAAESEKSGAAGSAVGIAAESGRTKTGENAIQTGRIGRAAKSDKTALELENVYFRYGKHLPDVLHGLNLKVYENEIFCLLGGNGSGKSTTLSASAGLLKPYSGKVRVFGKRLKEYKNQSLYRECLTMLPQDVQTVFLKNTVREELEEAKAEVSMLPFDITCLYEKHPYDLSGGEQQLVALAKVLATKPKLLLLDEPTKGLDAHAKLGFIRIMKELKAKGMTIVAVTHDVEFAALCADRCALFFRGNVVSDGVPADFFSENHFYTTSAYRMAGDYYDRAVTIEEVAALCRLNRKEAIQPGWKGMSSAAGKHGAEKMAEAGKMTEAGKTEEAGKMAEEEKTTGATERTGGSR